VPADGGVTDASGVAAFVVGVGVVGCTTGGAVDDGGVCTGDVVGRGALDVDPCRECAMPAPIAPRLATIPTVARPMINAFERPRGATACGAFCVVSGVNVCIGVIPRAVDAG
jgi:hypothetical protein